MSNPPVLPPEPQEPAAQGAAPAAAPPDVEPRGLRVNDIDLKVRESQTARHITISLLVMLGLTFITNLITMIMLTVKNRLDAAPLFDRMFSVWMPLLSGLVGSAVGFYLTKDKK